MFFLCLYINSEAVIYLKHLAHAVFWIVSVELSDLMSQGFSALWLDKTSWKWKVDHNIYTNFSCIHEKFIFLFLFHFFLMVSSSATLRRFKVTSSWYRHGLHTCVKVPIIVDTEDGLLFTISFYRLTHNNHINFTLNIILNLIVFLSPEYVNWNYCGKFISRGFEISYSYNLYVWLCA